MADRTDNGGLARFQFARAREPSHLDLLKTTGSTGKHLSQAAADAAASFSWLDQSVRHALLQSQSLTVGLLESLVRSECSITREAQSVAGWAGDCGSGVDCANCRDCAQKIFLKASVLREALDEAATLEECAALHRRNANEYLLFFYEIHLLEDAMSRNLTALREPIERWLQARVKSVNAAGFVGLLTAFKALFDALEMWQFKMAQKCDQSHRVYPCCLRLKGSLSQQWQRSALPLLQDKSVAGIWCHALAKYSAPLVAETDGADTHISVLPREDLLIVDNSSEELWKVGFSPPHLGTVWLLQKKESA